MLRPDPSLAIVPVEQLDTAQEVPTTYFHLVAEPGQGQVETCMRWSLVTASHLLAKEELFHPATEPLEPSEETFQPQDWEKYIPAEATQPGLFCYGSKVRTPPPSPLLCRLQTPRSSRLHGTQL